MNTKERIDVAISYLESIEIVDVPDVVVSELI